MCECLYSLFHIALNWKRPNNPSIGEWINKEQYINAVEHYSAIKRSKLLILLALKATYCLIPFMMHSEKGKSVKADEWIAGARDGGRELTSKEPERAFCGDGSAFYLDQATGYTNVTFYETHKTKLKFKFQYM